MAQRINPFALARPPRVIEQRTFEDPALPAPLELRLRAPDALDIAAASQESERLVGKYLTGEGNAGGQPLPFPPMSGGDPIRVNEPSLLTVARIAHVQEELHDDEGKVITPYSPEEFIAIMAVAPLMFADLAGWFADLTTIGLVPGNSPGQTTGASSEPVSATESTPNSPGDKTSSSE